MDQITVLLAIPDPLTAARVEAALSPDHAGGVGVVDAWASLQATIEADAPGVLIVDEVLLGVRPAERTRQLVDAMAGRPVIVVSRRDDQRSVIQAMRAGCADFLPMRDAQQPDLLSERIRYAVSVWRRMRADRRRQDRRRRRLNRAASTDVLTGLYNRRYLDHFLKHHCNGNDRRQPVAVAMLDLDGFKAVNDTQGHTVGDALLREVAHAIRGSIGPTETAIRWGGDEFLVVRPSTSVSEMRAWCDGLRQTVEALAQRLSQQLDVSISAGVHSLLMKDWDDTLMRNLDDALYLAKRRGRGRSCTVQDARVEAELARLEGLELGPLRHLDLLIEGVRDVLGPLGLRHVIDHGQQVGNIVRRMAASLHLDASEQDALALAGRFHDVGKLVIPEDLLAKPAVYSPIERSWVLRVLAFEGARLTRALGAGESTAALVRACHLPAGLALDGAGSSPSLHLRLLQAADRVASLTTARPHRPAMSIEQARRALDVRSTQVVAKLAANADDAVETLGHPDVLFTIRSHADAMAKGDQERPRLSA